MADRFPPGTRVHHYGHQWSEARWSGTATIVGIGSQNGKHFGYLVDVDESEGQPARQTEWPSHFTIKAAEQPIIDSNSQIGNE